MIILFPMNNQEKTTFLSIKYKKTLMTNWGYKKQNERKSWGIAYFLIFLHEYGCRTLRQRN